MTVPRQPSYHTSIVIPSVITKQVRRGIEDFLRTTFAPSTPFFHGILDRMFLRERYLFQGPFISVGLPFRPGTLPLDHFDSLQMRFPPYLHQEKAFSRLERARPLSTLISTGTGSGKTECFLYPILDYCWRRRNQRGIKAIIIYPMNALANDQAKRIARMIYNSEKLHGNVTAGMYVGESPGGGDAVYRNMTEDMIVTDRATMRKIPPDILLTNYKMLDYLLIRPDDLPLWSQNEPDTLRFLVVDELHTFDGAQGTDLACLVRRLKKRVQSPPDTLCCIGTSATLGGDDDLDELRQYAADLFGEPFDDDAVITEQRLTPNEFFHDAVMTKGGIVERAYIDATDPDRYSRHEEYLEAQYKAWFGTANTEHEPWQTRLADDLLGHSFFRKLIMILNNKTESIEDIIERLSNIEPELRNLSQQQAEQLVCSILALVSAARRDGIPFLNVRVQLWMRELRRIVADIAHPPQIRFSDDLNPDQVRNHLPLVHCRECGAMGWAALKRKQTDCFEHDLQSFYQAFFSRQPTVHYIFPKSTHANEGQQEFPRSVCGHCLCLTDGPNSSYCPECGESDRLIPVEVFNPVDRRSNGHLYSTSNCPFCNAQDGLSILGSRAASLLSVVISQLCSSGFSTESDKKLLAFSDSVQDAAHHAGFFEARTFRFNFRAALTRVLQARQKAVVLDELPAEFNEYWRARMPVAQYITTFLHPDMAWLADYEYLLQHGHLPVGSRLIEDMERRIAWEITSEYGFRARIGRTLEKSGCSIAFPRPDLLQSAARRLKQRLENEIGGWTSLDETLIQQYLTGWIHQMRIRGGIDYPSLKSYIESDGNPYTFKQLIHMPNFGRNTRKPMFLTIKPGAQFDPLLGRDSSDTWPQAWLRQLFEKRNPGIGHYAGHALNLSLQSLIESGILREYHVRGHSVWSVHPESLLVDQHVVQYQCSECGQSTSAAAAEQTLWDGMPCRRVHCHGRLEQVQSGDDYYGRLYREGAVHRIFAAEHTGLLERAARERLEADFIQQERPGSANLLTCTPTLEMGINIGDLSSVLLCTVPPTQSNYLQRVGRAGRRDGNAFNFTMAEGRSHDLYFFAAPLEMLAGSVSTPGVFLNAPAVLERQFVGFCFDRWVEKGVRKKDLPLAMNDVLNNLRKSGDRSCFPYNLLGFIEDHRQELLDGFLGIFKDALGRDSIDHLTRFVTGEKSQDGALHYKILQSLTFRERERGSYRKRLKRAEDALESIQESPLRDRNTGDEIAELENDIRYLKKILNGPKGFNKQLVLNFFTDEGLLPNYAFPEAGVTLRSVIFRKKVQSGEDEGEGKPFDSMVYEYKRPAVSAIHELAPANTFYSGSRKVQIEYINMELADIEEWRFCDQCPHAVPEAVNEHAASCPACGSIMWAEHTQQRRMLRLRQVEARSSDRQSRVDDTTEAREPVFYNKHMLVETNARHIQNAWRLPGDRMPFGFEFLRKADFREINFGLQSGTGEMITIAGYDVPAEGFRICKSCGRVRIPDHEEQHSRTCRYAKSDSDAPYSDFLYLYRQFSSEAIRILLPVTSFGDSVKEHSLIAALFLGLKKKFKGNIDHLETTLMETPIEGGSGKKKFLILYDRIPGGTGYLKELTKSKEAMMELLEISLDALRSCGCQNDPEKDGCYHCLYAFRLSRDMAEISRKTAMQMLTKILEQKEALEETDSVSNITIEGLLESELEARFIEELGATMTGGHPTRLSTEVVRGKPGWQLEIGGKVYLIEPQVRVRDENDVGTSTVIDLLFHPERADQGPPIAVFTDGYAFHASERAGRMNIATDTAQRMSLLRSGQYRVWTITWDDLPSAGRKGRESGFHNLAFEGHQNVPFWSKDDPVHKAAQKLEPVYKKNSFEALVQYLSEPDAGAWKVFAHYIFIARPWPLIGKLDKSGTGQWLSQFLEHERPGETATGEAEPVEDPWRAGEFWFQSPQEWPTAKAGFFGPENQVRKLGKSEDMHFFLCLFDHRTAALDPEFKQEWQGFWHFANLLQFLDHPWFVTSTGLQEQRYPELRLLQSAPRSQSGDEFEIPYVYQEAFDLADNQVHALLRKLAEADREPPEIGYELPGARGEVAAMAELTWPEQKVAVTLPDSPESDIRGFTDLDWSLFSLEDCERDPDLLIKAIPQIQRAGQ